MPPAKKLIQDDSSSSSKAPGERTSKAVGKKAVTSHPNGLSGTAMLREPSTADLDDPNSQASGENKGLSWSRESLDTLQAYRFAHRLPNNSPFSHPAHQALLTNPGIGQRSPTAIAKRRNKAMQQTKRAGAGSSTSVSTTSKQDLGAAVRRHFNSMPAEESATIADLMYKVHHKDKAFRLRSRPERSKTTTTTST